MKTYFGISAETLAEFDEAARKSAEEGATHLAITENLPIANWQFDTPGDPYPSWFAFQPGLLKTFPPEAIRPFVDLDHAERVGEMLRKRSAILERYGLRGLYHTTEPQVLPEAVFAAFPQWRGPRVDQVNRSRVARFAPCVGNSEVLRLYEESIQLLLRSCPSVDTFVFLTIDSGSGFCWAPSLYPGANGCASCRQSDLEDRAIGFVRNLADSAEKVNTSIEIDLVEIEPRSWMRKTFRDPRKMVQHLPPGLSINHHEGPDGEPYANGRFENLFFNEFYPVIGLPRPFAFLRKLIKSHELGAKRTILCFNDGLNTDLNVAVYHAFKEKPVHRYLDAVQLLQGVAETQAGAGNADALMELWRALDDVEKQLASLNFGPFILMGGLLARWITRPFVPFPEELTEQEREPFFPFLFQARDEQSALNLIDIQAMRMFEGWGARLLVEQTVNTTLGHLQQAISAMGSLEGESLATPDVMLARLELLQCLLVNGRNAVSYQAQLDRLKLTEYHTEEACPPPPLGSSSSWDRMDLVNLARSEIDNTYKISKLVKTYGRDVIDLAPEGSPESIMRLSCELAVHLDQKMETMHKKWPDYDRLSPPANP